MARSTFLLLASTCLLDSLTAANACNGDNCLSALRNHNASAIPFCNSYTAGLYSTAAPTPTFVPTTCSPQRLSSACYCADQVSNPTFTPPACPSSQVIQNPSFYGQPERDTSNVDIRPWVLAVPSGVPGCVPAGSYSTADMTSTWGDPRSIQCYFDPVVGGLSTITQDIKLCPSARYTLRLASACNFWTGSGDFGIQFQVTLSGVTLLPWGPVCPLCSDPNGPDINQGCRSYAVYENHNATFTAPASGAGSLVISVRQAAGLNATQVPALFDQIFVNPVGDTSETDPAEILF